MVSTVGRAGRGFRSVRRFRSVGLGLEESVGSWLALVSVGPWFGAGRSVGPWLASVGSCCSPHRSRKLNELPVLVGEMSSMVETFHSRMQSCVGLARHYLGLRTSKGKLRWQ